MNERTGDDPSTYFANTAPDYDAWYESPQGAFIDEIETELVFDLLPPPAGKKVLDVGCGTGNFSFKLARQGCEVTGIDVSPHMLWRALRKSADSGLPVSFCQADALDLPFSDDHFDAVYSVTTFEFIGDRAAAVEELRRVLKPGGRMVVGTIADDSPWGRAYRAAAEKDPESVFRHADFPTRSELERMRGDEVIASEECLFIPPDAEPDSFRREEEERRQGECTGGFFAVAWEKKCAPPLSCQIALYPLAGAGVDADEAVREVLGIVTAFDAQVQVNPMSSVLRVTPRNLGALLQEIAAHCRGRDLPYSLVLTASNACGVPTEGDGDHDGAQ